MHRLITSSLALSLLASVSGISMAQEPAAGDAIDAMPETTDESAPENIDPVLPADPEEAAPAPAIPEAADTAPQQRSTDIPADVVASDEMIGMTVYDLEDEKIGTVTGIVSNDAGEPEAVLEFGGFFGLGTKEMAVPLSLFRPAEEGRLIVNLTEDELYEMYEMARRQTEQGEES